MQSPYLFPIKRNDHRWKVNKNTDIFSFLKILVQSIISTPNGCAGSVPNLFHEHKQTCAATSSMSDSVFLHSNDSNVQVTVISQDRIIFRERTNVPMVSRVARGNWSVRIQPKYGKLTSCTVNLWHFAHENRLTRQIPFRSHIIFTRNSKFLKCNRRLR